MTEVHICTYRVQALDRDPACGGDGSETSQTKMKAPKCFLASTQATNSLPPNEGMILGITVRDGTDRQTDD